MVDGLIGASGEALIAIAKAAKASGDWEQLNYIGEKLGVLPLIQQER